jgi:excisionase family DNA binding protein
MGDSPVPNFSKRAFTIDEFCDHYNVGKTTAYTAFNQKKLQAVKLGTKTLIPVEAAEQWFQSLPKVEGAM